MTGRERSDNLHLSGVKFFESNIIIFIVYQIRLLIDINLTYKFTHLYKDHPFNYCGEPAPSSLL
jgi:hypothetical protein